jgi:uncharacterized phiE125 gp8 family phage protein
MNYLIKTVQPTTEPVSLVEAQLHLRLDTEGSPPSHPDDTLVQALIVAARENAEQYTGVTISQASYQVKSPVTNEQISLQTYPVTQVASVTYEDSDGATQTVSADDYYVDNFQRPARLVFKRNSPAYDTTVTFTAGFTDGNSPNPYPCPAGIKAAILLMVGNLYENRESVAQNATSLEPYERPQSYIYLLTPHRINMGL